MLVDQVGRNNIKVLVLKAFERNPRRISEDAFNQLKKSFSETGYHQRIIATEDLRVIGGHQRIKALKELSLKQVPVLVPDK
jgi:ParB-like chromosome segregation protein Spo0J